MGFFIQGTIVQVLPAQSGVSQKTGNKWQRISYVIEHEHGQYPKKMVFDVANAKINELNIQPGETGTVYLNCDVREYNGKMFNSIEAWKFERQQVQQPVQQQTGYQQPMQGYQQPMQQPYPQQQPMQQPVQTGLPFPPAQ